MFAKIPLRVNAFEQLSFLLVSVLQNVFASNKFFISRTTKNTVGHGDAAEMGSNPRPARHGPADQSHRPGVQRAG
jgi:hypothetical protein